MCVVSAAGLTDVAVIVMVRVALQAVMQATNSTRMMSNSERFMLQR